MQRIDSQITTKYFIEEILSDDTKRNQIDHEKRDEVEASQIDNMIKEKKANREYSEQVQFALNKKIINEYDLLHLEDTITRTGAARILHGIMKKIRKETDIVQIDKARKLKDLYTCHTCVNHIVQVYEKGVMHGITQDEFGVFAGMTKQEFFEIKEKLWIDSLRTELFKKEQICTKKGLTEEDKKETVIGITMQELEELRKENPKTQIIDLRKEEDRENPSFRDSCCIDLHDIYLNPYIVGIDKFVPYVTCCMGEAKSQLAAIYLMQAGYEYVRYLKVVSNN